MEVQNILQKASKTNLSQRFNQTVKEGSQKFRKIQSSKWIITNNKQKLIGIQQLFKIIQNQHQKQIEKRKIKRLQNNFYVQTYKNLECKLRNFNSHSSKQARDQIFLMQKCRNQRHVRKPVISYSTKYKENNLTLRIIKPRKRLHTQQAHEIINKIDNLIQQCQKQNKRSQTIRNNVKTFKYYCKHLDYKLKTLGDQLPVGDTIDPNE